MPSRLDLHHTDVHRFNTSPVCQRTAKVIAEELGADVDHRTSQYKNNVMEQDHRGIKDTVGHSALMIDVMRQLVPAR
jgi:transposase-like protein